MQKKWNAPLIGLLSVQLLTGVMLMPMNNFLGIFLNEIHAFPMRKVAQVIALGQIVGMFASLIGGPLSDRWGKRTVLIIGIAAISACCTLYLMQVRLAAIILWGVGGAGLGLSVLSSQGYLTLASRPERLGLNSALYNWGYTVGGAIGVPLLALILGEARFPRFGISLLITGVIALLVAARLPQLRANETAADKGSRGGGYAVLLDKKIIILILLRFLPTCYYGVMTLLPLLIKQHGGSNTLVAAYASVSAVVASLAQLAAGRAADKFGSRLPTSVAFGTIILASAGTIATANTLWGLYVFGIVGVSAAWALSTLLPGLVKSAASREIHGRVFGMLHLLWTLAMILGTLLAGWLLETTIGLPFLIVGVLNVVALGLTVPFFRLTDSSLADIDYSGA